MRKVIPYEPHLKELAKKLRNESTLGEALLWKELSSGKMHGYDFHRQKPLLKYITDFYCNELNLIIEIDGQSHHHEEQYNLDLIREQDLKRYNLNIIRFTEKQVRKDMMNVLRVIEQYVLDYKNSLL